MQATFPHLAVSQDARFWLAGQSLDIQESISGAQSVVPTLRGKWNATVSFALHEEAAVLQWQAFLAQMQGRIGTTLVPVYSRFGPKDRDGNPLPFCDIANIKGAQTWEHFGFENTDVTRAYVLSDMPLRASEIDLIFADTTGLRPGQYFSINDRLHRVQHHWQPADGVSRIRFEPPLRKAVKAGQAVELAKPVCLMRCVSETEGLFDQSLNRLPTVTLNFVEADSSPHVQYASPPDPDTAQGTDTDYVAIFEAARS